MSDANQKSLLAVMAHPDDESFGIGGTLAKYAREGVDVHLICATDGASGTVSPELLDGYASISELRLQELRCAADKLGLASMTMAGYRDSGMAGSEDNLHPHSLTAQKVEDVAANFAGVIRKVRPQVVVTHDPIGNYGHPDHIACQLATEAAFHMAGDPSALPETDHPAFQPRKLYYNTFPKQFFRWVFRFGRIFGMDPSKFGRNEDIDVLALLEQPDFPIHLRIDHRKYSSYQKEASQCHVSQLPSGPPNSGWMALFFRLMAGKDLFMRAFPEAPAGLREKDMFEGI